MSFKHITIPILELNIFSLIKQNYKIFNKKMKINLFLSFHLLIIALSNSFINCEFEYFDVVPHVLYLNSPIITSYAVTHPPGTINCIYYVIDHKTRTNLIQKTYLSGARIPDSSPQEIPYTLDIQLTEAMTLPVYRIKFYCTYHCNNGVDHEAGVEYNLFTDRKYNPGEIIPFNPKVNYVNDNTELIVDYLIQPAEKKKEILENNVEFLVNNKTEDSEFYLQQSILVNNFLTVTNSSDNPSDLQISHGKVIEKLNELLKCDSIIDRVFKHPTPHKILSLSAVTFIYQTSKSELFYNSTFMEGNFVAECLNSKGFQMLEKLKEKMGEDKSLFENIANDYITALSIVSSNNIGILKGNNNLYGNKTTEKNDSLIVDEVTLGMKKIVEEGSELLVKNYFTNFEEDKIKTNNLVFFSKKFEKKREKMSNTYNLSNNNSTIKEFSNEFNINYENLTISNNKTSINISLPIDHLISKYSLQTAKLGVILYDKYPLLASNNQNYSNQVISVKLYDENDKPQKVENLTYPINIIFKRPDKSYNVCLYFDEHNNTWNDKNCSSIELSDDYILCNCTHLTDFTISKFNPIYIFEDIKNILAETNWMTGFEEFKYLNADTAVVIYIYSAILVMYFIGLVFTFRFDLNPKRDNYYFNMTYKEKVKCCEKFCFSRKMIVEEVLAVKQKTDETMGRVSNSILDFEEVEKFRRNLYKSFRINHKKIDSTESLNDLEVGVNNLDNFNNLKTPLNISDNEEKVNIEYNTDIKEVKIENNNKNSKNNSESDSENETCKNKIEEIEDTNTNNFANNFTNTNSKNDNINTIALHNTSTYFSIINPTPKTNFLTRITSVLKILQEYNLYTALVMNFEYKLNKTDVLSLIIFNISLSFAVCGLFSPCNSISGKKDETSTGEIIWNRGLAVSILTLIIVNVPTTLFKLVLSKKFLFKGEKKDNFKAQRTKFMFFHVFIYFLMFSAFSWSVINTTWIYLRNYSVGRDNDFLVYFFVALFVKMVNLFILFFIKTVLFYFIVKSSEVPTWKKNLIILGVVFIIV